MPIITFMLLVMLGAPAWGADRTVITLFLDGARVEREAAAIGGRLEVRLPPAMRDGSLRVKPLGKGSISRVEVVPAPPSRQTEREVARLVERREALEDRLKALEVKEEVFTAAAKSQSGKAPRKTKNNPEPLASIRQGTEFAVGRLEEVYAARRKAERELKAVSDKIEMVRKSAGSGGSIARVRLTDKAGRVLLSYIDSDLRWTPAYDFRLGGAGAAEVTLIPMLPQVGKDARVVVSPGTLSEVTVSPVPGSEGGSDGVIRFSVPVRDAAYVSQPSSSLVFSFVNNSARTLPAGEAAGFWKGEYLGTIRFAGAAPGEARELRFGR